MEIDLGRFQTSRGTFVDAWIEPNYPALRGGVVRDSGFLCVEEVGWLEGRPEAIKMRLESMSEEAWRLQDAVGHELAKRLWAERRRYDQEPFYLVRDHAEYGRLYFSPAAVGDGGPQVSFQTRPEQGPREGLSIPEASAADHLQALFSHEYLFKKWPRMPTPNDLASSQSYGRTISQDILDKRARFINDVRWDFDARLGQAVQLATGRQPLMDVADLARYQSIAERTTRPAGRDFVSESPQHYQWFDDAGFQRVSPLTAEQLADKLFMDGDMPASNAYLTAQAMAASTEDWRWFREKRLGKLLPAVGTLEELVSFERSQPVRDDAWLAQAFSAADVCGPQAPSASRIYSALEEYVVLRQQASAKVQARHIGVPEEAAKERLALTTDPYYRAAIEALDYLQEANAVREPVPASTPKAVDNIATIDEHRPEPPEGGDDTMELSL